MTIQRRKILIGIGSALGVATMGISLRIITDPRQTFVRDVIAKRLFYLQISAEVMERFVVDFLRFDNEINRWQGKFLSFQTFGFSVVTARFIGGSFEQRLQNYEQRITTAFLLATDFFDEGAVEDRALSYVQYVEPYEMPCRNPIARF